MRLVVLFASLPLSVTSLSDLEQFVEGNEEKVFYLSFDTESSNSISYSASECLNLCDLIETLKIKASI